MKSQHWSFDHNVYNALPTLEDANSNLSKRKNSFERFVREASDLLRATSLGNGELGAFLLHRHWTVEKGSMMVERPRVLESGRVALITASVEADSALESGVMPSRWCAPTVNRPVVPLEFSSDPFVLEVCKVLADQQPLLSDLAQMLQKHKLQKAIGYMVIPRQSLSSENFDDFVETNKDRISIVTGERLSPLERVSRIRTGWPLSWSRIGSVWKCCYCSHGPGHTCKHRLPDPPICQPHGCV